MATFCSENIEYECENNINPAYVLTQANPDIPQDILTHVLRYYQRSPQEIMAFEHKKAVCSSVLVMIRKMLKNNRSAMPFTRSSSYVSSDVTQLFLEDLKKKIKKMRNNDTKLEVVISLLNSGKIRSEMSRFNKNNTKGMYSLTYSFISKKLKQNTHLVNKY